MLIHRVNVRDPPTMNIAAYIVGMQRVGVRRTVAAVILIASDSAITTLCLSFLPISRSLQSSGSRWPRYLGDQPISLDSFERLDRIYKIFRIDMLILKIL